MKNYIQEGETITLTTPYAVLSGGGALVGSIFGVANVDYAISVAGEYDTSGVFDLSKVSAQAWTAGALIYWDDATKLTTTVLTGNKLIGVALLVAANPSSVGRVRLNGAFIA